MKRVLAPLLLASSAAAIAVPGGPIGFLRPGAFQCEMPGDATGAAGLRVPQADFVVVNANSYSTPKGRGTYLLTGDLLQMTSGPLYGTKYRRVSASFLRGIGPDDRDTDLRCVRRLLGRA